MAFYGLDYIPGFEREFDLTDTSIQHSFTEHERVSVSCYPLLCTRAWFDTCQERHALDLCNRRATGNSSHCQHHYNQVMVGLA